VCYSFSATGAQVDVATAIRSHFSLPITGMTRFGYPAIDEPGRDRFGLISMEQWLLSKMLSASSG